MSDKFYDDWRQAHGGKPHPHTRQVVMELKDRDVWEDLDALARGLCAKLRAKTGWTGRIESHLETNVMVDAGGNEYGKATVRASAWVPAGKWVGVSSLEAFEAIAEVREVQESRLVSWGPCSDPLPHLTFKVKPGKQRCEKGPN